MRFVDWRRRPAVLYEGKVALAMLSPGGPWVRVDHWDVFTTGLRLMEPVWRARFEGDYGPLNPPAEPPS